jgi:hypothetical protein
MTINRRFLYAGLFLVAMGSVLLVVEAGLVDSATLAWALRLWPVALLAIGASLVLRRTSVSLPAGMLAAGIPGLLLGSAFALGPRFAVDCGAPGEGGSVATQQGAFDGPANVSVRVGCGALTVSTTPGNGWRLDAAANNGRASTVMADARSLSIGVSDERLHFPDGGQRRWNLTLPTTDIEQLNLITFANDSHIALPGARIGRLSITANASDMVLDVSGASVSSLYAVVNVGSMSIHLPANSDVSGVVKVGAGDAQICAPPGVGLRMTSKGFAERIAVGGLQQTGREWQSPDYESAAHHAELNVTANFGAIEINPIGGCR